MNEQVMERGRPRKSAEADDKVEIGRARVSREVAERRARRSRTEDLTGYRMKLSIPKEQMHDGFEYRWVNDDGMRVHALTQGRDYEVAPDIEPRRVGTKPDGSAMMAYAVRKPEDWAKEDRAAKVQAVDRSMEAIGNLRHGQSVAMGDAGETAVGYAAVDASVRRR